MVKLYQRIFRARSSPFISPAVVYGFGSEGGGASTERQNMIYRNQDVPEDGREWTAIREPSRAFVDTISENGNDVYIVKDKDGITWAIFAMPLLTKDEESV